MIGPLSSDDAEPVVIPVLLDPVVVEVLGLVDMVLPGVVADVWATPRLAPHSKNAAENAATVNFLVIRLLQVAFELRVRTTA